MKRGRIRISFEVESKEETKRGGDKKRGDEERTFK